MSPIYAKDFGIAKRHALNIAYNLLARGDCLEDLELLGNNEAYMDASGGASHSRTTADDYCRRPLPHHTLTGAAKGLEAEAARVLQAGDHLGRWYAGSYHLVV